MRSTVVIAAVAVGLFAGMFMMAFFRGLAKEEVKSAVELQLSHIQLHNPAFPADRAVNYTIANSSPIIAELKNNSGVKAVSGRVITAGMASSASAALGVEIHGIRPAEEKLISSISEDVAEGDYFLENRKNEILIGKKLAEKLGLGLHSKIVLTFQSVSGDLTSGSFRITGIFHSPNSSFDLSTVFTRLDDLSELLGTGDQIHEIAVLLNDGRFVDPVAAGLKKTYPRLLVQSWKEISPEMALLTDLFDQVLYIIIGIILLALMFGIINTMLMAVLERQHEFGMLMAIGMNKQKVFLMIVYESLILTCIGIPAGILFTISSVYFLAGRGIDLSAFSKALSQYGFGNRVFPELDPGMFLPITLMTALTALLSAIYPAIKALQCKPVEAIHKI